MITRTMRIEEDFGGVVLVLSRKLGFLCECVKLGLEASHGDRSDWVLLSLRY